MASEPKQHDRAATDRAVAALVGQRLGRFHVRRVLGAGSMAHVLEAEDVTLQRAVALKVLPYDKQADPRRRTAQSQFLREARAAANVVHPAIVQVFEVGIAEGFLFIAMELLEAGNLQAHVDEHGPLEPQRVVEFGRQAADALAAAHERGVLHRDLKPANLMLATDGRIKLADFGLARLARDEGFELPWKVVGTPRYMAPENVKGRYSQASDLFSLGATLWFALTGAPPFDIEKLEHVAEVQRERRLPELGLQMPHVPRALWAALERAMSRQPDERFDDARRFAEALQAIDLSPVRAGRPARSRRGRDRRRRTQRKSFAVPRWLYHVGPAVLIIAIALTVWLVRRGSAPSSVPAPTPPVAVEPAPSPSVEPVSQQPEPAQPVVDEPSPTLPEAIEETLTEVTVEPVSPVEPTPRVEPTPAVPREAEPLDAADRAALEHAAASGRAVRVRGRVVSVDYQLDASPKRAELVFADAEFRVIIGSRFFGPMTQKFGGKRGSGIVGREIIITGKVQQIDAALRLTIDTTRHVESLGEPDEAIAQRYAQQTAAEPADSPEEQAADEATEPAEPPIEAADTQRIKQLLTQGDDTPHTIVGRVVGKPALRSDGSLVVRLRSQLNLVVVCDPSLRPGLEKKFGPRAAALSTRTIRARGSVRQDSGRAPQVEVVTLGDLKLIRP